jgi:hypothetical protein
MPVEFWQDVCQRDLYLTAEETVALGLADKILEPKKRGNLRRMRQSKMKIAPPSKDMKQLVHKIYGRINKVKIPKIELNEIKSEPADPQVIVRDLAEQEKRAPELTGAL